METSNGTFFCSICRRKYVDRTNLRVHMRRSHPQRVGLRQPIWNGSTEKQQEVVRTGKKRNAVSLDVELCPAQGQNASERLNACQEGNMEDCASPASSNSIQLQPNDYRSEDIQNQETIANQPIHEFDEADWYKRDWNVSRQVVSFFQTFADTSETLYPKLTGLRPLPDDLNKSSKDLLSFCMKLQLTLGEGKAFFDLIRSLEGIVPEDYRFVSSTFPSAESFANYVDKLRKWRVREEGWKISVINTSFGSNKSGVYRSVLCLLLDTLKRAGGTSAIQPFKEKVSGNERYFSNPCDSKGMGEYQRHHRLQGKIVGIDIYSDGTILAKSGSQSANCVRVRMVNIKGYSKTWQDVGITPTIECGDQMKSDHEKRLP